MHDTGIVFVEMNIQLDKLLSFYKGDLKKKKIFSYKKCNKLM